MILSCTVLYNLQGGFLNGSGSSKGKRPVTEIKRYQIKGIQFPYMSAQSWKKLLRDTFVFLKNEPSYYDRLNGKAKIVLDPIAYLEDDLFGYSHPFKKQPKQDDPLRYRVVSANRVAPLLVTNLVSLQNHISKENGFLHLVDDTPLPYTTEFSSGWFLGRIVLDLDRVGVFVNSADIIELPDEIRDRYPSEVVKDTFGRYTVKNRKDRVRQAIELLFDSIMGLTYPPKASQFMVDFSPKVLLATLSEGMAPFGRSILSEDGLKLNIANLLSLVSSRGHTFKSPVILGFRSGLPIIDPKDISNLKSNQTEVTGNIMVTSPGQVKDKILEFLEGAYHE